MMRALRFPLLTAAVLSAPLAPAWSQSCVGITPFTEGPLRLGVSRAKPGNDDVRSAHIAVGELDGLFVDASYSRIKPLSGPDIDLRGHQYGVAIGVDWRVWRTKGLFFCPTLELRRGQRNSIFLAPQRSNELTDDHFAAFGGALGPSSGAHDGVVISPTAGIWFARDRSAAASGVQPSTREFGVSRFGVGLVILKRYSLSLLYERDFATAAALSGFAIVQASIDMGK